MKEWFKKYLGFLGFGVWMIGTLIFIVAELKEEDMPMV